MTRNLYKASLSLMSILMLVVMLFTNHVVAEAATTKVKVGYYEQENFQEGADAKSYKRGFAYDYYQLLATKNGWDYEYVYGQFEQLQEMLDKGEIDLLAMDASAQKSLVAASGASDHKTLGSVRKLWPSPHYLAVNKQRPELLDQLDVVQEMLIEDNNELLKTLSSKYFAAPIRRVHLNKDEKDWVASHKELKIGVLANFMPFASVDEQGNVSGVVKDLTAELLKELGITDQVKPRFVAFANSAASMKALQQGEVDVIFPIDEDRWVAEQKGMLPSDTVVTTPLNLLFKGKKEPKEIKKIAANSVTTYSAMLAKIYYPKAQVVPYKNLEECYTAIAEGKVDGMVVNRVRNSVVTGYKKAGLNTKVIDSRAMVYAVKKGNVALLSLLNHGIAKVDRSYSQSLLQTYDTSDTSFSFLDFVHKYHAQLLCVGFLLLLGGMALAYWFYRANKLTKALNAKLEASMAEQEAQLHEISNLNDQLQENQGHLEEAIAEQEAQLEEITALNTQLEDNQAEMEEAAAEQEAQLEEISALNEALQENKVQMESDHEKLNRHLSIVKTVAKVFTSIYYVDLKDYTFVEIGAMDKNIQLVVGQKGDALAAFELSYKHLISAENLEEFKEFTNLKTLRQRLAGRTLISMQFHGHNGWAEGVFIPADVNAEGYCDHVIWGTRDISEIKDKEIKHQKALEEAVAIARSASAAKSDFLSRMSHDIRTPMNVVVGMTEIARRNLGNKERVEDCLNKINMESIHLQTLINDILDISAIESGKLSIKPEEVRIKSVIDNIDTSVRSMIHDKALDYSFELGEITYPYLKADSLRLSQIMLNLLSNAVKYTPAGGKLTYKVWQTKASENVAQLHVRISDTGMGMSKEFMENMYSEFAREVDTRVNKIQGTGLGLAIVKQLVDMMHGTIEVTSEVDKGTTFDVVLPLEILDKQESVHDQATELRSYECAKGLKVLIAEDNDLNYEIAYELLKDYGLEITRALNGEEAVELLMDKANTYDLILMDMQMPVMGGLEATRAIRELDDEKAKHIPIIAMTANAFAEDVTTCIEAGMDDHVGKPIDVKVVLDTILKVLDGRK